MATRDEGPKRALALTQLERVCRIHQAVTTRLTQRPQEVRILKYWDTTARPQRIVLDATFNAGVRKIRQTLMAECSEYGLLADVIRIVKQTDVI